MKLKHYAYIGDAVWELFVREIMTKRIPNSNELHKNTTSKVNAEFQQEILLKLQELLTEEETELVRRGRNIKPPIARKSNQGAYRMATAFEVLVGWWYFHNKTRLLEMENILKEFI